jgi:uncharacterized protein
MKNKQALRAAIDAFFHAPAFAVVGVSANQRKFGNVVYRTMRDKGCRVFPVHRSLKTVEGQPCYASVLDLPEDVKAVVTVVPPEMTRTVVQDCLRKGISTVWMQQGSQSDGAIAEAEKAGLHVVHGECVLMFLEPVTSVHGVHRWMKKLFGSYPVRTNDH